MASSDNGDHARPAAGEEEPPPKQLKLSVQDYQIPSSETDVSPIATESVAAEGVMTLDNGGADLESALPEDGSNVGFRVDDAQVGALETVPSRREESRIAEDFVEGTKPEDLSSSGDGLPLVTELDASPMVTDEENVGLVGAVPIPRIGDEERVQMPEHEETKIASGSSVSVGDTANGLHSSGATAGAPTGESLGQSLPSDLGAGTSSVQRTKTSLCSYFRKKGCRHGAACRYAHGEEELQPRPDGSWDPTSERAKALLLQQSAALLPAEGVANAAAVEVPAAPVNAPFSDGAEDSGVNPLSKCIVHVPRAWSVDHFKKFLTENSVSYTTAKKRKGMSVAFVGFKTPEDVVKATEVLDGKSVNKKRLKVAESRSRSWEREATLGSSDRAKDSAALADAAEVILDPGLTCNGSDGEDLGELELAAMSREGAASEVRSVCDAVTPLADKTYEEQLSIKRDSIVQVLKRLVRNIHKGISSGAPLPDWISSAKDKGGLPCAMEGVLASPLTDGYRNKCEFSIGCSADGERVVGFQVGSFREGMLAVAEPTDCRNVSKIARTYAAIFQEFVRQSELPVWNKRNNSGFWRLLIVREGRATRVGDTSGGEISEVMLVAQVCPNGLPEETRAMEYAKMAEFLATAASSASPPLPLTALLVQDHVGISNVASADAPLHPLVVRKSEGGVQVAKEYIHDHINSLQFRISPTAFFQVNTLAAERLYSLAGDWAGLTPDTILFDVCCGTGTIGLTLAHRVGLVVGIEMNASAVADAQKNAEINNITNCRFVCSKAEDIMDSLLNEYLADGQSHAVESDNPAGPMKVDDDGHRIGPVEMEQSMSGVSTVNHERDGSNEKVVLGSSRETEASTLETDDAVADAEKGHRSGSNADTEPRRRTASNGQQEGAPLRQIFKNIVAIVDPPRVGLHPVVLKTLRLHTQLRRLVYISCNPQSLLANAVELCTPLNADLNADKGKGGWRGRTNWKGMSNVGQARHRVKKMPPSEPFRPVKAIAVDLFPHTIHCEMVMLFER